MLEHPWIKMRITVLDGVLDFELSNSKPEQAINQIPKGGTGLANVRKRLDLLYSNKHLLTISDNPNSFHVHLELPLYPENIAQPHFQSEPRDG